MGGGRGISNTVAPFKPHYIHGIHIRTSPEVGKRLSCAI